MAYALITLFITLRISITIIFCPLSLLDKIGIPCVNVEDNFPRHCKSNALLSHSVVRSAYYHGIVSYNHDQELSLSEGFYKIM